MSGSTDEIIELPVSWIVAGHNDRHIFDEARLRSLGESIQKRGLNQPITVRPAGFRCGDYTCQFLRSTDIGACPSCGATGIDHVEYEIVSCERRWRASVLIGLPTIRCMIDPVDDDLAAEICLLENGQRVALNPIKEAQAYARRRQLGWPDDRTALAAGCTEDTIRRRIKLLDLVPEIQQLVATGALPVTKAETLTPLDANRQRIALRVYNGSGKSMSVQSLRELASRLLEEQAQDTLFDLDLIYRREMEHLVQSQIDLLERFTGDGGTTSLPMIRMKYDDNVSVIMLRYAQDLEAIGQGDMADVIRRITQALVEKKWIANPSTERINRAVKEGVRI